MNEPVTNLARTQMKKAHPYLNFKGTTEAAFDFYRNVFGVDYLQVVRFRDFGDNPMGIAEADLDKIAHIAIPLGDDTMLMGTDVVDSMPATFNTGNNFYIMIEAESSEEATSIFERLSDGGAVEMPLQQVEWAELYGICRDRFETQWMITFTGDVEFNVGT
jgi:PhnB protein